jgi:hypothetical protein
MEALDKETFSVGETLLYEMIHNRHKHQREEHLRKSQPIQQQDEQSRRKHMNSRRSDVSNGSILIGSLLFLLLIISYIITETYKSNKDNRTFGKNRRFYHPSVQRR